MTEGTYWLVGKARSENMCSVRFVINKRGIVTEAAPLIRKFKGHSGDNLVRWFGSIWINYQLERSRPV